MSTPGLFVPTYGPPVTDRASGRTKNNNRAIPTPLAGKRSLMPSLVFNGKIEYVQSFEAAESAARAILAARPEVMGFDIEWQVSFVAGEAPRPTATLQLCAPDRPICTKTSTATSSGQGQRQGQANQSSSSPSSSTPSSSTSVWGTAFVFHLSAMRGHPSAVRDPPSRPPSQPPLTGDAAGKGKVVARSSNSSSTTFTTTHNNNNNNNNNNNIGEGEEEVGQNQHQTHSHHAAAGYLPESLVRVLSDPGILLAGVGVGGDVNRLESEYEQLRACGVEGVVNLSEVAKRKVVPDRRRRGMWSLADLCDELLQLDLRKPNSLRTGSWEKRPLSVDQLFCAAADAYAGLRLWQVMRGMPDLVLQRAEANAPRRDITPVADVAGGGGKVGIGKEGCVQPVWGGAAASSGDSGASSVTPKVRPRLPQSKLETHRLWHEDGLSVDAVAEVRCNKASTIRGYLSDCIEAGLPYEWSRLGIDPDKEQDIFRALLAATGNHHPPAATGRDPTTAPATRADGKEEAKKADDGPPLRAPGADGKNPAAAAAPGACGETPRTPLGAAASRPPADGLRAAASRPPTPVATGTPARCGGAAAAAAAVAGTSEGPCGEERGEGDDGSCCANVAARGVSQVADVGKAGPLNPDTGGRAESSNGAGTARVAAAGGEEGASARGAGGAGGTGRWESVRLKEVKELAPSAEYWEIRMVLARLKAGWRGYSA